MRRTGFSTTLGLRDNKGGAGLSRRQLLSGGSAIAASLVALNGDSMGVQVHPAPPTPSPSPEFAVTLLEEKEVIRDCSYPACALFCRDGTIILSMEGTSPGGRKGEGEETYYWTTTLYSMDLGQTWRQKEVVEVQFTNKEGVILASNRALYLGQMQQLSDGSIVGIGSNILNDQVRLEQAYRPWVSCVRRAKSPAQLLKGNYIDHFARIEIPNLAVTLDDIANPSTGHACKVVEMENGDLILPMEGTFNNDLVRIPYHTWETHQWRSWLCRSTDGGNSWYYLSTIASPAQYPLPSVSEGYCEPDVIKVDGAKLLAVMRTGGCLAGNGSTERYTDLVASISRDGGVTWESPRRIFKFGVCPRLLKMSNGVIACAAGRPGVFLLFSRDGGETWSKPHIVNDVDAAWGSGYTSIGEVKPGVLCLFYDDVHKNGEGRVSHLVKMRKYQVG